MKRDFSVLITVYNRERGEFLRASLASVFAQTVPPAQVVLVKDDPLLQRFELHCLPLTSTPRWPWLAGGSRSSTPTSRWS